MNPALDCGIDRSDSLLVAYLPKLDAVLQETPVAGGTLMSLDGVALDIVGPKRVRWWQVRREAFDNDLALPTVVWQGFADKFSSDEITLGLFEAERPLNTKLYMRAYSHGPWICIEKEQLREVYGDDSSSAN